MCAYVFCVLCFCVLCFVSKKKKLVLYIRECVCVWFETIMPILLSDEEYAALTSTSQRGLHYAEADRMDGSDSADASEREEALRRAIEARRRTSSSSSASNACVHAPYCCHGHRDLPYWCAPCLSLRLFPDIHDVRKERLMGQCKPPPTRICPSPHRLDDERLVVRVCPHPAPPCARVPDTSFRS